MLTELINTCGTQIIEGVCAALLAVAGFFAKKWYTKHANDKRKREIADMCVLAAEQLYKDLHGEEKYAKCVADMTEMLSNEGIIVTDMEIRMLIESAVASFNEAFKKS